MCRITHVLRARTTLFCTHEILRTRFICTYYCIVYYMVMVMVYVLARGALSRLNGITCKLASEENTPCTWERNNGRTSTHTTTTRRRQMCGRHTAFVPQKGRARARLWCALTTIHRCECFFCVSFCVCSKNKKKKQIAEKEKTRKIREKSEKIECQPASCCTGHWTNGMESRAT